MRFLVTIKSWLPLIFTVLFVTQLLAEDDNYTIRWHKDMGNILDQPDEFYGSAEAIRIAETVILFQRNNGGWPKNYDRTAVINDSIRKLQQGLKTKTYTTFDNGSTHTDVRFLARVYQKTNNQRFRNAFMKGLDFILKAQYTNGGWPQLYPLPTDTSRYERHITFNDGAMIGVLETLREIIGDDDTYTFVNKYIKQRVSDSLEKGIQCILNCQYIRNGNKTVWGAQHDEETLLPAKARAYELPSLTGYESLYIVRFLMDIHNPSPIIIDAIHSAVKWFDESKLTGLKMVRVENAHAPKGWDMMVVEDSTAAPLWARFYDLQTNKPIFVDYDGIPKKYLAEIDYERRVGYSWLGFYGKTLLSRDYPNWLKKRGIEKNVLLEND